jgi:hypothetical protein
MALGREAIYGQLFNELQTLCATTNPDAQAQMLAIGLKPLPKVANPPFVFGGRRWIALSTERMDQYPSLMLVEKGETYERELTFAPAKVTLVAHVIVQTASGQNPDDVPAILVNNLADAVEDVIETGAGRFGRGANKLAIPNLDIPISDPDYDSIAYDPGSVFVCRISGREVIYPAISEQVFSEQIFEVEIIATH